MPEEKETQDIINQEHTNAHSILESKFKSSDLMKPIKKKKVVLNKRLAIIISSIVGGITLLMLIFAILVYFNVINFNSNTSTNIISQQSISSSISNSTTESSQSSIDENRLNFPRFFTSQETISISSSSTESNESLTPSIEPTDYVISLEPQNVNDLELSASSYTECEESTPVIGSNNIYTDQTGLKIEIGNNLTPVTDLGKRVLELNKNFITGNAFLMADASSDWNPDFLNYFKSSCTKTNYEKIADLDTQTLRAVDFFDSYYTQIEIYSTNSFINYGYSIYGLKDSYITRISREYQYDSGFLRVEKEACQDGGEPDKDCLINFIIENKLEGIKSNLVDDVNRYKFNQ